MNASVLDESGKSVIMQMGCYGIGVTRIVAAAIEQNHDAQGIIWPAPLAPFQIALIPIGLQRSEKLRAAVDQVYGQLLDAGYEVLLDDREARPGVMFADMELIGIPHRLVLSEKTLNAGVIEYKNRRGTDEGLLALENLLQELQKKSI
jgi:prolyl-tRNA synthetase